MTKQEEPKEVKEYRENIRNKSIRDIIRDAKKVVEEPKKETPVEQPKEEIKEESKEPEKAEVHIQSPEDRKKELELIKDAAVEATRKSYQDLKEEIQKIKDSDKTEKEKKEEIKELKTNWSGFDPNTGQKTPKDYDEIVQEARRVAFEDFKKFYQDQKQQELQELEKVQEEEKKTKEDQEKAYQERITAINKRVEEEMEELYASGKLRKPKDINDTNDPAAKKVQDLFNQAAAMNIKRQQEGKPLIDSIAKYYFLYYKPSEDKQPAGADAPIMGGKTAPATQEPERFNYARDIRQPTFKQILYKARKALGK